MSNLLLLGAGGPVSAPGGGGGFTVQTSIFDDDPALLQTSFVVPMPSGSGGRLLMAAAVTWTNTVTTPTDWSLLVDLNHNGAATRVDFWVFERDATGFTDTDVTLTVGSADRLSAVVMRINGAAGAPEVATPATGESAAPNPSSLSPSGGSAAYLWIPVAGLSRPSTTPTYPSGYTNGTTAAHATDDGNRSRVMVDWKEATAASEDPGAFGVASTASWVSTTFAYEAA